jgi:site-specific recombinase XerD
LWIRGTAAVALRAWLEQRADVESTGPVFCNRKGEPLDGRDVWRIVKSRAKKAGIDPKTITTHSFRSSFQTYNPAPLEARQDAAGHADPKTTRLYDRTSRGKVAFFAMPEIEDLLDQKKDEGSKTNP